MALAAVNVRNRSKLLVLLSWVVVEVVVEEEEEGQEEDELVSWNVRLESLFQP